MTKTSTHRRFRQAAFFLLLIVMLSTILVLYGWQFEIEYLKRVIPGLVAMNPLTAILFLISSVTLCLVVFKPNKPSAINAFITIFSLFIMAMATVHLMALIFDLGLRIDSFFFTGPILSDASMGKQSEMAANTALNFVLSGTAILLSTKGTGRIQFSQYLSIIIFFIALFSIVGYLYRIPEFYSILLYLPMAIHTAILFMLLSVSVLFLNPFSGAMAYFTGPYTGNLIIRILVPTVILASILIGYFRLWVLWQGWLSTEFGFALMIICFISIFVFLIISKANSLNKKSILEKRHTITLARLYKDLDYANKEVSVLNKDLKASLEEQSAINEELSASNDRLDSTNQQLIKAKETIEKQTEIIIRQKDLQIDSYRKNLSLIFSSTQEGILLLDKDAKVVLFNNAIKKILKKVMDKSVNEGDRLAELSSNGRRNMAPLHFIEALQGKTIYDEASFQIDPEKTITYSIKYEPVFKNGSVEAVMIITSDITEKIIQEEILRTSEANLKAVFNNTPDAYVFISLNYKIISFNTAYVQFSSQVSKKKITTDRSIFELFRSEQHQDFQHMLDQAKEGKTIFREFELQNGRENKWYIMAINRVYSENEVLGYCINVRDNTDIKNAELDLKNSETRFRSLVENIGDAIIILRPNGKYQYISESYTRIFGYPNPEAYAQSAESLIHAEDLQNYFKALKRVSKKENSVERITYRIYHKDGRLLYMEGTLTNLLHKQAINGLVLSVRDVTERKIMQKEADQNKFFREKANEVARIGFGVADLSNKSGPLWWSKEALNILGIKEKEYDGKLKSYLQVTHPEDVEKVKVAVSRAIKTTHKYELDHRIVHSDGKIRWVYGQAELKKDYKKQSYVMIGVLQDITERKNIEQNILEVNKRFEFLSKATNDAVWDWNLKTDKLVWNHALKSIFGYSQTSTRIIPWEKEIIHPDDYEKVRGPLVRLFKKGGKQWNATYRLKCKDGQYKYINDRAYIIYNEDKEPIRAVGSFQDITKLHLASEEIKKLSLVAQHTRNFVVITNARRNVDWVNQSFYKTTGLEPKDIEDKNYFELLKILKVNDSVVNNILQNLSTGKPLYSKDLSFRANDGSQCFARLDIMPVVDQNKQITKIISVGTDITELKRYERQITSTANNLRSLIENSNVPIFALDQEGNIEDWNKVTEELTGVKKEKIAGKSFTKTFVEDKYASLVRDLIGSIFKGNSVDNFELPITTTYHTKIILLISASPRRGKENNIQGTIIIAQNITELTDYRQGLEKMVKKRTKELNEALQKEKTLVALKSKFVSIASHEFKTPLSTISLSSNFIRRYKAKLGPADIDVKLDDIEKQVTHMNYLLEDVLTIEKEELGKIKVNYAEIDLCEFFKQIVEEIQLNTKSHTINFETDFEKNIVRADKKMVRIIMVNLLTNAIKFSPHANQVGLFVRLKNSTLLITVKDYGIGIPKKDIKNLFTSFYRASNAEDIEGTGLGLNIVKKTLDLLNGTITVDSKENVGTIFTVEFSVK